MGPPAFSARDPLRLLESQKTDLSVASCFAQILIECPSNRDATRAAVEGFGQLSESDGANSPFGTRVWGQTRRPGALDKSV